MLDGSNVFTELILGLALYNEAPSYWKNSYPAGLIHAMNAIALDMGGLFPKTFTAFIALCHKPLQDWYPYPATGFSLRYAVLDNGELTEQASDYIYGLPDDI